MPIFRCRNLSESPLHSRPIRFRLSDRTSYPQLFAFWTCFPFPSSSAGFQIIFEQFFLYLIFHFQRNYLRTMNNKVWYHLFRGFKWRITVLLLGWMGWIFYTFVKFACAILPFLCLNCISLNFFLYLTNFIDW